MSFILRAALVIGALSYFALQRDGRAPQTAELKAMAERQGAQVTTLAGSLPTVATQAVTAELVKRLSTETASRDTLLAVDRRPDWRGSEVR